MLNEHCYYLSWDGGRFELVNKEEWVRVERAAGFVNTLGQPEEPGTGGFGGTAHGRKVEGRIRRPGQPVE